MNKSLMKLGLVFFCVLTSLNAYEMKPVGFKAVGMGGAGVASTRGSLSSYYNPALLRFSDYTSELSFNTGIRLREANIIEHVNTLSKIDFGETVDNISDNALPGNKKRGNLYLEGKNNTDKDRENINIAQETLKQIGSDNAVEISAVVSFATQFSDSFAIGYYKYVDAEFNLNIDPNYTELIFKKDDDYYSYQADDPDRKGKDLYTLYTTTAEGKKAYETSSIKYATDEGINYIRLNAEVLDELPLSYAVLFSGKQGSLSIGGSLKFMKLQTIYKEVNLGKNSKDIIKDLEDYTTTYKANAGLDLGLAYRPYNSKITLGVVAKNVYLPEFKVDEAKNGFTEDYIIDPMYRAGISIPVWNDNIEFALDIDLSKNKTLIKGEKSQMLGGGVELHPSSWFALRLGAMQDLSSKKFDDGVIMTSGLGIGLKWFQIDVSAMASTNTGTYDDKSIPKYSSLNVSIISRWGDGYNK
jgi:hypothetical protein